MGCCILYIRGYSVYISFTLFLLIIQAKGRILYIWWNSCSGVLDPEELAAINSKLGKIELPALPGIQLDMQKSFESNATLESSKTCTVQKPPENTGKGLTSCSSQILI